MLKSGEKERERGAIVIAEIRVFNDIEETRLQCLFK